MSPIDIRYWVKLHKRSQPMETINLKYAKGEMSRHPSSSIIIESVYPTYHEFKLDDPKLMTGPHKIVVDGELSTAMRNDVVTSMFNKVEQFEKQLRKKNNTSPKIKNKCKCK